MDALRDIFAKAKLEQTLRLRGWSLAELATACGIARHSLIDEASKGFPSGLLRRKIEGALGFVDIWSSTDEMWLRKRGLSALNVDFAVTSVPELARVCAAHGLPTPRSPRNREHIEGSLKAFLAANPQFGAQKTTTMERNKTA